MAPNSSRNKLKSDYLKGSRYVLLTLVIALSCSDRLHDTIIRGRVLNWGNKQPIDSALVTLGDGMGNSGFVLVDAQSSSNRASMVYTDADGNFEISLTGEYRAILSVSKKGFSFDSNYTDGVAQGIRGFGEGTHDNVLCELQSKALFNGLFSKTNNRSKTDTLYIKLYSWLGIPNIVEHNDKPYVGEGPFYYKKDKTFNGPMVVADTYLRYHLKYKEAGRWIEHTDSVYLKGGESFKQKIEY